MNAIQRYFPTFAAIKARNDKKSGFNGATNTPRLGSQQWQGMSTRGNFGGGWLVDLMGLTRTGDWRGEVGEVGENSLYQICMRWIAMQAVQAPLCYQEPDGDSDEYSTVEDAALFTPSWLLKNAHPLLSMPDIIGRTSCDLARGNAYWLIARNDSGKPVGLWWFPRQYWTWILHEDWTSTFALQVPGGAREEYDGKDVIHFRLPASDPDYPFLGDDPVMAQLRHLCVDNEAGQYTHAVLKNFGVSPVAFAWKDKETRPTGAAMQEAVRLIQERFTGENRGKPNIFPGDVEITELNNSPERMALDTILRTPEERVTACFGLNPIALQLGAGLENSSYNNITEARRAAWDEGIAPLHHIIQRTLTEKLLPEFARTPSGTAVAENKLKGRFWFDYSDVPALQEDENAMFERANKAFDSGGVTIGEKRVMMRLKPLDEGDERGDKMSHELGGAAPMTDSTDPATMTTGGKEPLMTGDEKQTETKAVEPPDDAPSALPDPHGVAFTDEQLSALTDTDNEAAVLLAYGKAGDEARGLVAAGVVDNG